MDPNELRFGVIGADHAHIYGIVDMLQGAGAALAAYCTDVPADDAAFSRAYPGVRHAGSVDEILEDREIRLIVSAAVPSDRAPLGIRAMQHGKDFLSDKPGFTTLGQLAEARSVQDTTGQMYTVFYNERLASPATVRAGELVREGAIGRVIQTVGLGPHRVHPPERPRWFYDPARSGGILVDIAAHQADQFLFFTGSREARVVSAQVANYAHPEYPGFEDFGDVVWQGDRGTGYARVDWFTPAGLPVWGDGRLIILGTDGYVELRKNVDLAGRPGSEHLFLVNRHGVSAIDCEGADLPFGRQYVADVLNRTQVAMTQAHCFLAAQLALEAEAQAQRLGYLA